MSKRAIGSSPQQPYLFYIVLVGVGLGTVAMGLWPRLALLSAALAVVNVVCGTKRMVDLNLTVGSITRGSLLGLVVALPLLVFLAEPLRVYTQRLYVTSNTDEVLKSKIQTGEQYVNNALQYGTTTWHP